MPLNLRSRCNAIGATLPAYTGTAMIVIESLISIGLLFSSVVRSISILLPIPILPPMARAIFADVCVGEKKYDVIACICFHKRKYSDFCPKVTKYIDKMYKDIEDYCNMGVKYDW